MVAGLLIGLDAAAFAATQEVPLASLPGVILIWCIAWLLRRMSVQATGVKDELSKRFRNIRRIGEAVGLFALIFGAWEVCRLGGSGHAMCIAVPAVVGSAAAWGLFARRNRSLPTDSGGVHAR